MDLQCWNAKTYGCTKSGLILKRMPPPFWALAWSRFTSFLLPLWMLWERTLVQEKILNWQTSRKILDIIYQWINNRAWSIFFMEIDWRFTQSANISAPDIEWKLGKYEWSDIWIMNRSEPSYTLVKKCLLERHPHALVLNCNQDIS